jgi:hypothetical protein
MQIARESAISCKWVIITLAIAASLFFNYLAGGSGELWNNLYQMMQKPGPLFFAIISISFFNGTLQGVILLIGSVLDKNDYHVYHLIKESSSFTFAYADIIVISIIVFMLVFIVYAAFALLTFLLKLILANITLNKSTHSGLYFILVGISMGLAFISIKYTFSLPLPLIYAILLIKLSLSSSSMTFRQFSNVTNIMFPLTLSLVL